MNAKDTKKPRMRRIWQLAPAVLALLLSPNPHLALAIVGMQSPEAAVRAYNDAINARSVDELLATTAETLDVRLYKSDGTIQYQKARSRLEQRNSFEEMLRLNPNSQTHIISLIVSGPVVIERAESTGLPGGASEIGLTAYRILDGRIMQMWILNTEGVKYGAAATP
jgi:hypothetical protein